MKLKFKTRVSALIGSAAAMLLSVGASHADQVITDDLIVQFSACIGNDCTNGENFGFDTLRLKENNTRIAFTDTSSSGSFPTTDWTIVANDSNNGGDSYLAFQNDDSNTFPFRVMAAARNNTLHVTSAGNEPRIGVGLNTPSVALHVRTGNSPALRLDQDGSSGFASQVWDIAGNETNFFIRDVTNGSELPFRIKPGAPDDAIFIAANGNVGMGTQAPGTELHLAADGPSSIRFDDTGDGGKEWDIGITGNGTLKISEVNSGAVEFRLSDQGMFRMNAVASPPTLNAGLGAIYADDSGALCFNDGATWVKLGGQGACG